MVVSTLKFLMRGTLWTLATITAVVILATIRDSSPKKAAVVRPQEAASPAPSAKNGDDLTMRVELAPNPPLLPLPTLSEVETFAGQLKMTVIMGYRPMTIQQYVRNTPAAGTKVAIPAHVADANTIVDNGRIYTINGVHTVAAARISANIILGNTLPSMQENVLKCIKTAMEHLPCSMMILGKVDVCEGIVLGVRRTMPCIDVMGGWNLAQFGTYQQAIELKIDMP